MILIQLQQRNLLERIVLGVAAVIILVTAFFFLAAAILVGAVLAAVLIARIWWVRRKIAKAAEAEFISTEYRVVEREWEPGGRLPGASGGERHADGDFSETSSGMSQPGNGTLEVETPRSGFPAPDKNVPGSPGKQ